MIKQINNQNIVSNLSNPQMYTTFKANPVVATNALERTPTTDTLVKPTQNKTKKTLLTLGALALAGVGIFTAIKAGKAHQQKKAIQEIEKKFADLQNDMPRVQKTFKEVFLREDLTKKEALEILNRYKDVEKIRITGSKEEYARALFDEAKNNYGFANTALEISYKDFSSVGQAASYTPTHSEVIISSHSHVNRLMNIIHHELRHVKQCYLAINAKPKQYVKALAGNDEALKRIITEETVLKPFNLIKPNKKLVSNNYNTFIENVIEGAKNRHTYSGHGEAYHTNITEVDARFAGESIAKLFGLMAK